MTEYFLVSTKFGVKAKRVYVAIENLMSRQSCLSLCHNRVNPPSRQKLPRHGVFHLVTLRSMSRQWGKALRRNQAMQRDRDALSRQYGPVLRRDREGHASATDQAGPI